MRLQEKEQELNVIPNEQFGFRHSHSTTDQALKVVEQITTSFNWSRISGRSQGIRQSLALSAPPQAHQSRIPDRTGENRPVLPEKQDF
jgi:hypothetical protein